MIRRRANQPSSLEVAPASRVAATKMSSSWESRQKIVVPISRTCVPMKSRKIGTRTWMLSLTPRRFRTIRTRPTTNSRPELPGLPPRRQEAEDLVAARGDGDGDRQHVVDDEGAARHDPELRAQELRRDEVAAAARREELDDLAVGERDDADRDGGENRQPDRQVGVGAEGLERFLGAVRRGGQSVGAQAHPGEKGGEGDGVEDPRIHRIPGLPDEDGLDCAGQGAPFRGGADYVFGGPASQTRSAPRGGPGQQRCGGCEFGGPDGNRTRAPASGGTGAARPPLKDASRVRHGGPARRCGGCALVAPTGIEPVLRPPGARGPQGPRSKMPAVSDTAGQRDDVVVAGWWPQRESNPCSGLRGHGGRKAPAQRCQPCPTRRASETMWWLRFGGPNGNRTRAPALKEPCPNR